MGLLLYTVSMFGFFKSESKKWGPAFVAGASDDDPAAIATYAQAGAGFGYLFLWSVFLTTPIIIAVQEMCVRIALVTHRGLVANIKKRYGRWIVGLIVVLLLIANTVNLGADLGMMGSALELVVPGIPFWVAIIGMACLSIGLEIFLPYKTYARYLKWISLSLLAFVATAFVVSVDWMTAFRSTLIPQIEWSSRALMMIVALLGATISPYLFFWEGNQEIEEEGLGKQGMYGGCKDNTREKVRAMRWEVSMGMLISNLVAWFIMLTTATVLFGGKGVEITTAGQVVDVLGPLAGKEAAWLFAIGIIGTGLITVPIFAGTIAYAVAEWFGWKEGLSKKWWQAKGFYLAMFATTIIGILINAFGIPPVQALIYSAVINGLIAPVLIFVILRLASDPKVMGECKNGIWAKLFGWFAFLVMTGAVVAWLIVSFL